jgi:hypothetical protein
VVAEDQSITGKAHLVHAVGCLTARPFRRDGPVRRGASW